jgi:proteasome lid subunit RPN8/RPN11
MEVFITDTAFCSMLIACVETYRKECLGLLMGLRTQNGGFIVQQALPYQIATRSNKEVRPSPSAHQRMEKVLKDFPHVELVGDFHSHPARRNHRTNIIPSEWDLASMEADNIYLILLVRKRAKEQRWSYNEDGTISGTLDDYFIKIAGWYLDEGNNGYVHKPRTARLRCPFALDFRW